MCFFVPSAFFFSSGRRSFLVLLAPWHAGGWLARTPYASLGPAEVRGTCSGGSKWQVRSGGDSKYVEPSRPMKTHVHHTLLTG